MWRGGEWNEKLIEINKQLRVMFELPSWWWFRKCEKKRRWISKSEESSRRTKPKWNTNIEIIFIDRWCFSFISRVLACMFAERWKRWVILVTGTNYHFKVLSIDLMSLELAIYASIVCCLSGRECHSMNSAENDRSLLRRAKLEWRWEIDEMITMEKREVAALFIIIDRLDDRSVRFRWVASLRNWKDVSSDTNRIIIPQSIHTSRRHRVRPPNSISPRQHDWVRANAKLTSLMFF